MSENGTLRRFLIKNRFLCVIKDLWELACEFSIVIYANIRAYIKLFGNHAKKLSLNVGKGIKCSFRTSRVRLSVHQIPQNFESLYNILHILTRSSNEIAGIFSNCKLFLIHPGAIVPIATIVKSFL